MTRPALWKLPVSYAAIGATQAADLMAYPPPGYRPYEKRVRIGHGPVRWDFAWHATLSWGIKLRSGFTVDVENSPSEVTDATYTPVSFDDAGTPVSPAATGPSAEAVYGPDGMPFIAPGDSAWLVAHFGPFHIGEPVRVVYVIDEPNRKGYAYGTLPGHPFSGEEAFIVERSPDGSVWLTIRSLSRPATGLWRAAYPILRLVQGAYRRRYFTALTGPTD
ncbi:MAG: hypothetical protein JWP30_1349 [Homoserinimonas sp.]|jgi:uncharacterized protein (UPF0548 family)|nr:hypothetical protein [Homoserinimonas sp.]